MRARSVARFSPQQPIVTSLDVELDPSRRHLLAAPSPTRHAGVTRGRRERCARHDGDDPVTGV